ncbi:MAG: CARDB domain-containing protein [Candidatus Omnitrophica bacterium]|nr:CARDB domain-containing protein [Candidatus Omnitrophota bacterium]
MIFPGRTLRIFFVLSTIFFAISLTGCAGFGGGGGPGGTDAGFVDGGAGVPGDLGANDVAAWDIWFETNGQRNSQPAVTEPGNLVLDVINSFTGPVTIHIQWFEDDVLRFEDDYPNIPIGESTVSAGYAFIAGGDHTVTAKISLVNPAAAEEPGNNQATSIINVQALGANRQGGASSQPVQGVDLTWSEIAMTDAAGNDVREPVAGVPVNIIASSTNNGDTTALNITRSFDMNGGGSDRVAQCAPGLCAPYIIHGYTFFRTGLNTFTLAMTGFTPGQAANARGITTMPVTVNVLPAGANPPPSGGGGGQQVQGVDLTWSELTLTDAAGNEVSEPVVGEPVKITAMSTNNGTVAAQNITRFLSIDGSGFHNDHVPQINPGQTVPFAVPNTYTFPTADAHTISLSMTGFTPEQAADASGTNPLTVTVHVRAGLRPVVGATGTVNTEEAHDLEYGEISYWQNGADSDPYVHQGHDQSAVYSGSTGEIRGDIRNVSNYNESDVRLSVKVNGQSIPGGDITLDHVPANAIRAFTVPYSFSSHGSYRISCDIDTQNGVRETNEGNNHIERIVNVTNPLSTGNTRDLLCFNIQFKASSTDPASPLSEIPVTRTTVGTSGKLIGTFFNLDRSSVNAIATLLVDNEPVAPARPVTNAGGMASMSQDNYSFTAPGIHKMKLKVMPAPGTEDAYESNNSVERDIEVVNPESPLGAAPFRPIGLPRLAVPVTAATPVLAMTSTEGPECELVAENVALWVPDPDRKVGRVTVGQRGWVSYTVKNKKGTAVNDVNSEVRFLLNGRLVETIPVKLNVPANGQATGKSDFTPLTTPGIYKMALVVDPLKQKKDKRRNNNVLTRSIRVVAPAQSDTGRTVVNAPVCELVADDVTFWVHGIDHPVTRVMVGQRGWVRYTIKNKEGKAVKNVHSEVRFLLNGQVMQIVPAGLDIPSQGQKSGKNDVAPFTTPGMYKMALMVDPLNQKKDNRRGDNVLTRSLQVDAYQQYNPAKDSGPSGTFVDTFPGLLDTVLGGKGHDKPSGDSTPPSAQAEQTPPPAQPPAEKSPRKFTTSYQS